MDSTIAQTLRDTWAGYVYALSVALPRLLAMASVIAAGWLIAAAVRAVTWRLLSLLRFPRLAEQTGFAELLRKAELPPPERMVAKVLFWLLFAAFLLAGLDALGFATLEGLLYQLARLAPRLVASLAILAVVTVFANLARRVVLLAAVNAGWPSPRTAAAFVHALLVILAVAMALDHLGVARRVVVAAFALAFGATLLAVAIAVGVGSAPLVRRWLEERLAARGRGDSDRSSHL